MCVAALKIDDCHRALQQKRSTKYPPPDKTLNPLNLKIPRIVVLLATSIGMWLISKYTPSSEMAFGDGFVAILFAAGLVVAVSGSISFRRSDTTVDPRVPENASSLVNSGMYKITRNPMYLGMVIVMIAWGLYLTNVFSIAFVASFVLYMTRFQIKPEEAALEKLFGEDYTIYKSRVRRWL